RPLFAHTFQHLAITGLHRFDAAAYVQVVDADENENIRRRTIEHGIVQALQDSAWIPRRHGIADDVRLDTPVQHAPPRKILRYLELFREAVAQQHDVFPRQVFFPE